MVLYYKEHGPVVKVGAAANLSEESELLST